MFKEENLRNFEEKKLALEKKDINLIVADFDDTIFERSEQFEKYPILLENRGNKGNEVIRDIIGIDNFIDNCFIGKPYPKTITSLLRLNHDVIITAGFENIQKAKLKSTGLNIFNHIVVYDSKEKPFELVKYVIEILQFIPSEIIIYEDRPNIFIQDKNIIEDFLGTKVKIMHVKMLSNNKPQIITEIV